jgi:hypothetical protein
VDAVVRKIPDGQWHLVVSIGTWRPECPVGRSELRRIDMNYRTFDGGVERGQLIASEDSVDDLVKPFSQLFEAGFPIEQMEPVERYKGDVLRSLGANNTSAFKCRRPGQINAGTVMFCHTQPRFSNNRTAREPLRMTPGPFLASANSLPGCQHSQRGSRRGF